MSYLRRMRLRLFLTVVLALFSSALGAAEGIIYRNPDATGEYCHLKFPAIREDTLGTDRPVLKDPSEGDIIDFYGPCNHDPLGKAEVHSQRGNARRQRDRIDGETD
ncbi:MAG: hypothetical protein ACREQV_01335 [Candidatus Binatia bacterium]